METLEQKIDRYRVSTITPITFLTKKRGSVRNTYTIYPDVYDYLRFYFLVIKALIQEGISWIFSHRQDYEETNY